MLLFWAYIYICIYNTFILLHYTILHQNVNGSSRNLIPLVITIYFPPNTYMMDTNLYKLNDITLKNNVSINQFPLNILTSFLLILLIKV